MQRLLAGLGLVVLPLLGWPQGVQLGRFPDVSQLETTLQRGISTKADVLAHLGEPSGPGSFHLPFEFTADGQSTAHASGEVLFYQDMEVEGMRSVGNGVIAMQMRQRILLVFLKEGYFNGFMWYSNAGLAQAR